MSYHYDMGISKQIFIEDRDIPEEIPVEFSEDFERESDKLIYLQQLEEEYEWYNHLSEGFEEL